ncbi:hypothetical protein JCM10914A_02640 [Paenibacillus sp. JCM 10914]|uniref:hypothetical protein n=1 Tax=Paenibacillus sp. JCM 10914 TaxID=1236974 RepID=UPI0003CC8DE8|nr:hypothetical protein [Paenibacillus sp. JCM 10914]GAE06804.1 hypothetical protein JCM10914_2984 [Paenibacillus sp. JCM 10914]
MQMPMSKHNRFDQLITYTQEAMDMFGASADALLVIQNDRIVTEWYAVESSLSSSKFRLHYTQKEREVYHA